MCIRIQSVSGNTDAVNNNLAAKGFTPASGKKADLYVG